MKAPDDPFEPKLGKIRARKPKVPKSFRSKVLHATARSGGLKPAPNGPAKPRPAASKRGRGAGVARVLAAAPRKSLQTRRVVVKARYVKLAGKGLKAATAHLKYLQRDGVTREGAPGQMYGADTDRADGQAFMARSDEDRTQFRFIVAPEDSDQYEDLKPLTRKLMSQMEEDLGTKLDWVAVDHFNTGHPHTHIVVRSRGDRGQDLIIAREYISYGLRERAEGLVTLDLGPRSDLEIAARQREEIGLSRLTLIDRHLLKDTDPEGHVSAGHKDPSIQAMRAGRLTRLQDFGLAEEEGNGVWRLRSDIEATLRRMGARSDIIKTLHQELKLRRMEHAVPDSLIHDGDPADGIGAKRVVGRLLKRGLIDDTTDRHYVLIDGTDGRVHLFDIGLGDRLEPLGENAIIRVTSKVPEVRVVDRTIAEVAAGNGGYYNVDAHLRFDPSARQPFAETHVRRLEAIRRTTSGVDREADGRFKIGPDYVDKAFAYERREARLSPVRIDVMSSLSLEAQVGRQGVTWLDRELVNGGGAGHVDAGFGKEVRAALQRRQQWLMQEGLASEGADGQIALRPNLIDTLHRREVAAVAADLSKATGLRYAEARPGDQIEGKLRQSMTLGTGKFAVIERARDFTLVPWRPVLDNHVGKAVSGLMRDSGINWAIGRGKGIGIE